MSGTENTPTIKSMRHRQILDIAGENPGASLQEIADRVPSATVDLVERILEKHGDPATEDDGSSATAPGSDQGGPGMSAPAVPDDESTAGTASTDGGSTAAVTDAAISADDVTVEPRGATAKSTDVDAESTTKADTETDTASADEQGEQEPDETAGTDGDETDSGSADVSNTEQTGTESSGTDDSGEADADGLGVDELGETHRRALAAIHEHPEATQRELAEMLDTSPATVSRRVNEIAGFDWGDRAAFVDQLAESDTDILETNPPSMSTNKTNGDQKRQSETDHLAERVAALEDRVDAMAESEPHTDPGTPEAASESSLSLDNPDLAHRVAHACMQYDDISEAEEREVLKALLD